MRGMAHLSEHLSDSICSGLFAAYLSDTNLQVEKLWAAACTENPSPVSMLFISSVIEQDMMAVAVGKVSCAVVGCCNQNSKNHPSLLTLHAPL